MSVLGKKDLRALAKAHAKNQALKSKVETLI